MLARDVVGGQEDGVGIVVGACLTGDQHRIDVGAFSLSGYFRSRGVRRSLVSGARFCRNLLPGAGGEHQGKTQHAAQHRPAPSPLPGSVQNPPQPMAQGSGPAPQGGGHRRIPSAGGGGEDYRSVCPAIRRIRILQNGFVAALLQIPVQPVPQQPHQGIEPVEGVGCKRQDFPQKVPAPPMGQLMAQDPLGRLRLFRSLGQQQRRTQQSRQHGGGQARQHQQPGRTAVPGRQDPVLGQQGWVRYRPGPAPDFPGKEQVPGDLIEEKENHARQIQPRCRSFW